MEHDFKKELENFEAVWRRVSAAKTAASAPGAMLMPNKGGKSRAVRFTPPR